MRVEQLTDARQLKSQATLWSALESHIGACVIIALADAGDPAWQDDALIAVPETYDVATRAQRHV